jgi:O-antigen/teichoic acid export membrane protein
MGAFSRFYAVVAALQDRGASAATPSSPRARRAERYRLAALGALATVAARIAGLTLIVLTIRWIAPALSPERFGVWATFASLAIMLSFLDLGVGNALVNRVAHAVVRSQPRELVRVVTGGLAWLIVIACLAAALLVLLAVVIPWTSLLKLAVAGDGAEARSAAVVFGGLFGLNVVANGILKILTGQQRAYEAQLIAGAGALIACPVTWMAVRGDYSIGLLLAAGLGTQNAVVLVAGTGLLVKRHLIDARIAWSCLLGERSELLASSGLFFGLQVGGMVVTGADTLLLASIAGAADVAAFAVVQRLFLVASQPVAVLNGSLWAAYADAFAAGDHEFIRLTLRRGFVVSTVLGSGISLLLLAGGPWLIPFWTDHAVQASFVLLLLFACWTALESAGNALGTYLNGTGIVREQLIVVSCLCLVALPAKILATRYAGAAGLMAATICSYATVVIGLYSTLFRARILAPLKQARVHAP